MNQNGFVNLIVISIVLAVVLAVGGYFVLIRKQITPSETQQPITPSGDTNVIPIPSSDTSVETISPATTSPPNRTKTTVKVPTSPTKLDAGAPAPPADWALTEITILSQVGEEWKVRADKIRDYIRYPATTNPQLKVGDTVTIRLNGWLDTFQGSDKVCPAGYIKSLKPAQTESTTQSPATRPQPKIATGEKYLSKLFGCFVQTNCQTIGWSGWLYNPSPPVIEYECVKSDTTTPPSTKPQAGLPSVEPQQ